MQTTIDHEVVLHNCGQKQVLPADAIVVQTEVPDGVATKPRSADPGKDGEDLHSSAMDPLLQPFAFKQLTLRNRVVSTSHEPAYSVDGLPKDRYRAYHVEKARGGVGLTMIGGSAVVSPDSPPAFGNLELYRDEVVPWLARLADEVHAEGAAVMCQVTHLGRRTSNFAGDWLPLIAPTPIREPAHRSVPKEAEDWDLDRIVRDYAAAAERCRAAGLDGIELEAYGHLLDGFLSPLTNHREDAWGGSSERRMAFPRRVLEAVRAAVGADFVVGLRLTMDEGQAGGLQLVDTVAAVRELSAIGVDFLSVIRGTIESDAALVKVIPGMGTPSAPALEFAGQVRSQVGIPVMHAARISDVATARHALRDGLVDLVGMTRPQMADPYLVAKVVAGEEDRIRPCVGANYCLDAIYQAGDAKCVHNPATGRELSVPQVVTRATQRRKAVVVGAGPAGLEAARVLGERGHDVVVFEAADAPGGQVRLAATSPRRRDLVGIVDWRVSELKHLAVDLRLGVYAEVEDVLAESPDVVILATGGLPAGAPFEEGASLVCDSWDVLSGSVRVSGDVLVYDEAGTEPALDVAEVLGTRAAQVELVTPERTAAPLVGSMNAPAYLAAFAEHGTTITLTHRLVEGTPTAEGRLAARLRHEFATMETVRIVDHVVVERGTLPLADLYFELLPSSLNQGEVDHADLLAGRSQRTVRNLDGRYQLFRIGDAVTSRNIHAAVFDALRIAATL